MFTEASGYLVPYLIRYQVWDVCRVNREWNSLRSRLGRKLLILVETPLTFSFFRTTILRKYINENSEKVQMRASTKCLARSYLEIQRFFHEKYLKKSQYTELNLRLCRRMGFSVSRKNFVYRKNCRQPVLVADEAHARHAMSSAMCERES